MRVKTVKSYFYVGKKEQAECVRCAFVCYESGFSFVTRQNRCILMTKWWSNCVIETIEETTFIVVRALPIVAQKKTSTTTSRKKRRSEICAGWESVVCSRIRLYLSWPYTLHLSIEPGKWQQHTHTINIERMS